MSDVVYLSFEHETSPEENPRAFKEGAHSDGWVVSNSDVLISDVTSTIADGPHNAFNYTGASGFDATIDTGEAMVSASPIGRDVTTVVTLASSTNNQTVYAGFEPNSTDTVVIGLDGAFTSAASRIPIWEFDTDGSTVTASTDLRNIGPRITVENNRYETSDGSGATVDDSDRLGGVTSSNYARTDVSETFNQSINIATTASHLDLIETDQSDKTWRIEALSGEFVITEVGVGEPLSIDPSNNSRVEMPNGASFGSDVTVNNNDMLDINSLNGANGQEVRINQGGGSDIALSMASSGGTGVISIRDASNNSIAVFNDGGEVDVPNGNIETQNGFCITNSSRAYDVQKDGTDGNGVINFKTS